MTRAENIEGISVGAAAAGVVVKMLVMHDTHMQISLAGAGHIFPRQTAKTQQQQILRQG